MEAALNWLALSGGCRINCIGLAWLTGLATFSAAGMSFIGSIVINLTVGVLFSGTATAGEEIGWRGYMLMRLFNAKIPRPVLVSGVIWGLWHLPLILSGQYSSGPNRTVSAVIFMAAICLRHIWSPGSDYNPGAFGHRSFFMLRGIPSFRESSTNQPKRLRYGLVNPALWSLWLALF